MTCGCLGQIFGLTKVFRGSQYESYNQSMNPIVTRVDKLFRLEHLWYNDHNVLLRTLIYKCLVALEKDSKNLNFIGNETHNTLYSKRYSHLKLIIPLSYAKILIVENI